MILFNCRHCGHELEVPASRGGELEQCPTCGKVVEVPRRQPSNMPVARVPPAVGGHGRPAQWPMVLVMLTITASGLLFGSIATGPARLWGLVVGVAGALALVGGLPGGIAHARGHRNATAITVLGYLGLLTIGILWMVALVWALTDPGVPTEPQPHRRPCPRCGESIPEAAAVCRFCGANLR